MSITRGTHPEGREAEEHFASYRQQVPRDRLRCCRALAELVSLQDIDNIWADTSDEVHKLLSHVSLVCYAPCMEMKSKREAAELLGLSTRGVERAVRRGHLTVVYRDSKHGKTAWFSPPELEQYRQLQQARGPVGFTSGIPGGPVVGTLVPVVEMESRREASRKPGANAVPIADRLTLNVEEAAHLAGLPRSFILKSIHDGKLKAVRIGRSFHVKRADLNRFVQEL